LGFNYYEKQGFPGIDARHALVQAGEPLVSDRHDHAIQFQWSWKELLPQGRMAFDCCAMKYRFWSTE